MTWPAKPSAAASLSELSTTGIDEKTLFRGPAALEAGTKEAKVQGAIERIIWIGAVIGEQ